MWVAGETLVTNVETVIVKDYRGDEFDYFY